jgi:NAD(P)-dependent dehydrogenase (short-subunit alcohol dehydrogenase family)
MDVAMAARDAEKLGPLAAKLRAGGVAAEAFGCDATSDRSVAALMEAVRQKLGIPDLVVYNVEHFIPGNVVEIESPAFEECWRANCLGAFLTGREAARAMLPRGSGTIIFTGATASLRGRQGYVNMAVGKSGTRALAQSMARELGPRGIHVAHVIIDGGISSPADMSSLYPAEIAETYLHLHCQHRSTWTQELDLRPWVEGF